MIPFYPLRPKNGGGLLIENVRASHDYECKFNGWRSVANCKTREMFNRQGEKLSIAAEFKDALDVLGSLGITWADVEALERRHNVGRGTLILLDLPDYRELPYEARHKLIKSFGLKPAGPSDKIEDKQVYYSPAVSGTDPQAVMKLWNDLKEVNQRLGANFYEGVVSKKRDSLYVWQNRGPEVDFPFWMKHRWPF